MISAISSRFCRIRSKCKRESYLYRLFTTSTQQYDYVVVGGGSAGCVIANSLSKNPNNSVLLLEAGGTDSYPWIHIPVGYLYCIDNPRTDWRFRTTPQDNLNDRSLLYPRGKGLGGSSSINGMIYMRGQEQDYTNWAQVTGDKEWSWPAALKRYKSFENYHGDANEYHGKGGEWTVSKQRLRWRILDMIKEAAVEHGITETEDFNRGDNFGVGWFDVNQDSGWRLNSSTAFLKPVRHRQNLTILTGCNVDNLLFEGSNNAKRCVGVKITNGNKEEHFLAKKEVVLCGGSIGTVQILERSGVGAPDLLKALDIPVIADLPQVGENLADHLQLRLVFRVTGEKTLNTTSASLWGKLLIGLEYLATQSGPMSMAPSQLCIFAYSDTPTGGPIGSKFDRPNLQYHIQPLSLEKFGDPLHTFDAFTMSVCNLRPTSRGSVHINSRDPHSAPVISPNYLSTEEDRQVAIDAIKLTRRIVNSSSILQICNPEEYKPGVHLQTEQELIQGASNIGTTIFHPVGTCRMGSKSSDSVCDGQLRVRGLKGLRVADASVMPSITSGNTAAPTMLIANRAAELILAQN